MDCTHRGEGIPVGVEVEGDSDGEGDGEGGWQQEGIDHNIARLQEHDRNGVTQDCSGHPVLET